MIRAVLDTNVVVSGLRSRRGASFLLLQIVGRRRFQAILSVPLVIEYESVAKRLSRSIGLRHEEIDDILDYLCKVSEHRQIFYLWRPFLRDPGDDMLLEVAVEAAADVIVTHNVRDFSGVEQFGLRVLRPQEFLREIGEIP